MRSIEFLNPLIALMAHQLGLFTSTKIIRLFERQGVERWWLWGACKFSIVALVLLTGILSSSTLPINPEDFDEKKHADWLYYYYVSVALGLGSGALLTVASRMTNVICRPGSLNHEAYIPLYAYALTAMIIPLFVMSSANIKVNNKVGKDGDDTDNCHVGDANCTDSSIESQSDDLVRKSVLYTSLCILIFAKVFFLDRIIMKRMQEDYNENLHTLPDWLGRWFGQDPAPHVILQEEEDAQVDAEAQSASSVKGW